MCVCVCVCVHRRLQDALLNLLEDLRDLTAAEHAQRCLLWQCIEVIYFMLV